MAYPTDVETLPDNDQARILNAVQAQLVAGGTHDVPTKTGAPSGLATLDADALLVSTQNRGIRIREADGSPDVARVIDLIVSDGTLTDNGSGVVTLTTAPPPPPPPPTTLDSLTDVTLGRKALASGDTLAYDAAGVAQFRNVGDLVNIHAYDARGDARKVVDGAITAGDATFTSTTAAFVAGDVGKLIRVKGAGANPDSTGARLTWPGWGAVPLVTTIATYNSATSVALAATATTTVTGATTWFGTDDGPAIRAALAASSGGIYVPPGNYIMSRDPAYVSSVVYNDFNVGSPGQAPSERMLSVGDRKVIKGAGRDASRLISHGWHYRGLVLGDYCWVDGLSWEGGDRINIFSKGIDTGPRHYTSVTNCRIEKWGDLGAQLPTGSTHWTFTNNEFFGNWSEALAPVNNSNYHVIMGNHFRDNGKNAIGTNGSYCIIVGNIIENCGTRGKAPESFGSDIHGILAYTSAAGNFADGLVISGNYIRGCSGSGIYIVGTTGGSARHCVVTGNHISDCGGGVFAQGVYDGLLVHDNVIVNSRGYGVAVQGGSPDCSIKNNSIFNSGVVTTANSAVYVGSVGGPNTRLVIKDNKIVGGPKHGVYIADGAGGGGGNVIEGNELAGFGSAPAGLIVRVHTSDLANWTIRRNSGWRTEATGTGSIAAGAASAAITHGLNGTPTRVILTSTSATQGLDYWVSAKAATTFTITLSASAVTNPVTFDWRATYGDE